MLVLSNLVYRVPRCKQKQRSGRDGDFKVTCYSLHLYDCQSYLFHLGSVCLSLCLSFCVCLFVCSSIRPSLLTAISIQVYLLPMLIAAQRAKRAKQQFIILTYDIVFGGKISIHLTAPDCPIRPHCLTRFATRMLCGIWLHNHIYFFPRGDRSCEGCTI